MAFNKIKYSIIKFLGLVITVSSLVACDNMDVSGDEFIIGTRLDAVSSLSDTNNPKSVSLFDETTRRIHSFDLNTMEIKSSHKVIDPRADHYLIASNADSYIVDLSESQISIFDHNANRVDSGLAFNGKPISSAFNESTGHLVVYDDLQSVGVLKLSPAGQVEDSWTGGPILEDDSSIFAGDINQSGELILSLSDNSLAIVNLNQSLLQKKWIFTKMALPDSNVKWLAPITNDLVIYLSQNNKVTLYNISTESVINSLGVVGQVAKYSKANDPHVITKSMSGIYSLIYVKGNELKQRDLVINRSKGDFLQSTLNLTEDTWSMIRSPISGYQFVSGENGYINSYTYNREAQTYRFSDMLNLRNKPLPDRAQLKQASGFVFALYPSELGFAEKISLDGSEASSLKLFNVPFIK